ncbi:MAG: GPW/gp25 family protein, partial [Planctomycetota bacterium]|nr:GPW/gp25 family protein [Planctomycetota bacterium]
VLNYGIVDLTGRTVSGFTEDELVRVVREAILRFEPRLAASTLVVKLEQSAKDREFRAMSFRIEAELWAQPLPLQLYVKTEFDLESGHARIVETR